MPKASFTDVASDDSEPPKPGTRTDALGRPTGHVVRPEDRIPIVTDWSGMDDYVNAPPTYEAFAVQYYQYTRHLLSKFGFKPESLKDVTQDIMTRFIERDSIGVFSREWQSRAEDGKSKFRSYYSRFVVTYAPGKKRNIVRHSMREIILCDAPVDDGGDTWVEKNSPVVEFESHVAFEDMVSRVRSSMGDVDGVDAIIELAMASSKVKVSDVARALHCNQRDAKRALENVRNAFREQLHVA